jgi:hypothetical protein
VKWGNAFSLPGEGGGGGKMKSLNAGICIKTWTSHVLNFLTMELACGLEERSK